MYGWNRRLPTLSSLLELLSPWLSRPWHPLRNLGSTSRTLRLCTAVSLVFFAAGAAKAGNHHCYVPQQVVAAVEHVQFVAVQQQPYSVELVGENIRSQMRLEQATEATTGLLQEVRELRKEFYGLRTELLELKQAVYGGTTPTTTTTTPPEPVTPTTPTEPDPTTTTTTTPEPDPVTEPTPPATDPGDLNGWALQLLATRCASCHNATKKSGDYYLFEAKQADGAWPTKALTANDLILLDEVLYANEMPKAPHKKLDQAEYSRMRAWRNTYTTAIRQLARTGPQVPAK